jgi:protein-tyrosine phosphatase
MVRSAYSREIELEAIYAFRDVGGYRARGGRIVAWRRIFRSGELRRMTQADLIKLKEELKISSVIDLRNAREGLEQSQEIELLKEIGAKYFYIPLNAGGDRKKERELYDNFSNMGEIYLDRLKSKELGIRIIEALEIIANPANHPLVFHCVAGKDRSGLLAAILLNILGVADKDIVEDYTLTAPYMTRLCERMRNDPHTADEVLKLPAYTWKAEPDSMAFFLAGVRRAYGSTRRYLEAQGVAASLFGRLERVLLV